MKKPKFKIDNEKRLFMRARKTFHFHERQAKSRTTEHLKCQSNVMWLKNELCELGERVLLSFPKWNGIRAQA